ncbi:MAG: molybdopterin-dependent oxidoreductase [Rhodococcus sp. (in: high G+C Gram-positive bacteria)]
MRDLVPRRVDGLPPGQREVRAFPRFSDKPLRWAPRTAPIALTISVEGTIVATLTGADLDQFDRIEQVSDFHCVTTWTRRGLRWSGVRFGDAVESIMGDALPAHLVASSADGQQAMFVTDDLLGDDVLLATELDGQPLDREHGAPLRLVSPGQYGYKNVKHLIGLDFCHAEPTSTLGPKEHLRARVGLEERHASLPNWAVRIPYRLSIIPTALAAQHGLRKSPN